MQTLIYPGYGNEPARIDYGLSFFHTTGDPHVDIVAIHTKRQGLPDASLVVRNDSRDRVLNIILSKDLSGVRVDRIRFFILIDAPTLGKTLGFEFPIELDFKDYQRKGNSYQVDRPVAANWIGRLLWAIGYRPVRYWTRDQDVIGGCANFYTPFEERRSLDTAEVLKLADAIGHSVVGRALPKWLKDIAAMSDE